MLSFKRLGIAIISVILLSLIFCQAFLISAGAGYSSGVTERLFEEFPLKNSSYSYKSSGISKPATESASVFYSHALLTEPVNEMSKDLAKASVALSMAAYDPSYVNSLLSKMGFDYDDNSAVYNRSRNELTIDDNDYVAYTIGYKEWTDPETDETYVFYCVPIQGTTGNAEWFSNFNMGTGIEHEGFRLASLEVYLKLKTKFNMDNASDNAHRIVWLTGHSRGAACANLIAGWLSADGEAYTSRDTVTAYTFACPAVSTNADTTLKNIFNFNNAGDLITMVPMKNWGFKRYGQDIDLDTSDAQFANMQMQFNSVTGDTYAGMKTGDDFNTLITNLLGNDRDLYNDTVPLQFSLDLIAWALGGENDVSINDIGRKHYSGFSNIGNKLESILEVGSGIVNLGDLLFFLSSDASEKDYIADYSYRVYLETQGLTEEEFLDYISAYDIRNLISDIKKETTIVVDEASDFWAAYVVLNDRNHDTVAIIDCVQAAMNIVSDENGNPLDKIKHAHCQALYTTWINSMYYGYRGWAGNTSITDVTIDRGIYTVGEQCFTGCTSITNANMNRTVKFMGPQAFYNCSAIKELTIPVEYDPTGIFGSISGVEKITYYAGSTGVMQDRINNYNKTVEYLNRNRLTTVIFEEGITHIGSYAFYGYYNGNGNGNVLTNVTLPSTLQSIGDYAFNYCTSLTELTLPESLKTIGSSAFSNCSSLASVINDSSLETINGSAFYNCSSLTSFNLPDSVRFIGSHAFYGCSSLESLNLSDNLTSVGSYAFYNCSAKMTVPSSLTVIPEHCFYNCDGITEVFISDKVLSVGAEAFYDCDGITKVTIDSAATLIGSNAFAYCDAIKELDIPVDYNPTGIFSSISGVEKITYSFGYSGRMQNRTSSNYDDTVEYVSRNNLTTVVFEEGITHIGSYAFYGYYNGNGNVLTNVTLPSTLQSIGEHAFSYCTSLTELILPEELKTIGSYAFYKCTSLESLNLSDNLTSVGSYAFYNCSAKMTVPSSLTVIPEHCFYNCDGITEVFISDKVLSVGAEAFYDCDGITKVTIDSAATLIGSNAFAYCDAIKELDIPVDYNPTGIFSSISGVEKITYSFGYSGRMQNRTSSNYDDTVEYVSRNNLTTVVFEEGITHIGSYAFYGYYNGNGNVLTNVTLPSTLQSIGDYAFSYCTSLAEITLPESLDRIGSYAFSNSGISKIVFCGDAPVFSSNAFNGLTATVYYPKNNDTWSEYTMLQYGGDITWVEGDEYTHVHSLEYFDAKAPTCTEGGWDAYEACRVCDYSTYVEIPATGHSPEYFDSKAPTCTEGGWDAYEACSVCGYSTYVELPAFGHFYVDGSCESCGEVDPDATLPEPELPDAGDVILGDVNGDGVVNGKDSNVIRKILGGSYSASELETLAADVNRDGLINGVDANYIARYIAGNITDFN